MSLVKISSRGQITIPVNIRSLLGVEAKDKLELVVRGNELVIQPLKSFKNLRGSLIHRKGDARGAVKGAVAKHVLETDK